MAVKKKLFVSTSGGETSEYMGKYLLDEYSDEYDMVFMFANTGGEDDRTLDFVRKCDDEFEFNTVWVEALIHKGTRGVGGRRKGRSTGHTVVNYESASRNNEPFEAMIKEYGIPNHAYPHCTRELKLNPMLSYIKSIGWKKGCFSTAIGIRIDEDRRVSKKAELDNIIYPFIDMQPTTKEDVKAWWKDQVFQLGLMEHEGNCITCHKKSMRKINMLIRDNPKAFDFNRRMELENGLCGYNEDGARRVFFRGDKSTDYLFNAVNSQGMLFEDTTEIFNTCGESCELLDMDIA